MNRKKLIIIGVAIFILVASIAAYFLLQKQVSDNNQPTKSFVKQGETVNPNDSNGQPSGLGTQPSTSDGSDLSNAAPPTTQDYYDVILKANPYLADTNGQPSFGITKVVNPLPGWFVVTLKKSGIEPAKVILQQTNNPANPLTIVAGPGTSFPPQDVSLPDAVRRAL